MSAIQSCFLPDELHLKILSHFTPQQLAQTSRVSQLWHRLAFDKPLWDNFDLSIVFQQPVRVIDERVWMELADDQAFRLSFQGIAPLDNRAAIPELSGFFAKLKQKKIEIINKAGVTILTFPKNFNADLLSAIAATNQGDQTCDIPLILNKDFQAGVYLPIENDRILLTNEAVYIDFLKQIGCRKPLALEATALAVITFKSTRPPLKIPSWTICQDQVKVHDVPLYPVFTWLTNNFALTADMSPIPQTSPMFLSNAVCPFDGAWKPEKKT